MKTGHPHRLVYPAEVAICASCCPCAALACHVLLRQALAACRLVPTEEQLQQEEQNAAAESSQSWAMQILARAFLASPQACLSGCISALLHLDQQLQAAASHLLTVHVLQLPGLHELDAPVNGLLVSPLVLSQPELQTWALDQLRRVLDGTVLPDSYCFARPLADHAEQRPS